MRRDKDEGLIELTLRYDRVDLRKLGMRVTPAEIAAARASVDAKTLAALELARDRILDHHRRQVPAATAMSTTLGVALGYRWTAVQSAGLYVPGGTASYPSSVLMNAIPAKVAGSSASSWWSRRPTGMLNPLVLAAAQLAGVDEIYRVGGAQAIAALAYGTETIAPVAKIVGPGNAYVAAAKRQVFGQVGIDMIAGPSEVLVIADKDNDPAWIAADLLAQAEHDTAAQAILITDDAGFGRAVAAAVETELATLPRAERGARELGEFRRHHPGREPRRAPRARRPPRAGASRDRHRRSRGAGRRASAMPARSSSAATRPKSSATMSPGRTTCCQPRARARFASGPRRARFHEAHLDPQARRRELCARSGPPP